MSSRTFTLSDALYDYVVSVSLRETDLLQRLRKETATLPRAHMQIAPEQGQFMTLLVRLIGAKRCLEIGVFTGYSTLCAVSALPPDGRVVACDVNEEWTAIARRYWNEAGVADRIDLHLAPAVETLDRLLANGQAGRFDFAFIDADKPNYHNYYERALALVRPGGLVAVDNTLWYGRVADAANHDEDTEAIRAFNARLKDDARIELSLVPIGDGMTLALKR
ncbi:MAG: class I SAM-dependent methyltransferase [Burkholderiales bacterium]